LTPTLPFLYLPDAITLIVLLVLFSMLRSIAIDHMRQELLIIRKEMLLFWLNNGLDYSDSGYTALVNRIDSLIRLAPKLSPGRLAFIYRLQRKLSLPNRSHEVSLLIEHTVNANGREKLKKLQMELNLGLGTFYLIGSLSGWLLLFAILPRMLKRTIMLQSDHRTDIFFDLVEKVLGRIGRQAGDRLCGAAAIPIS
jgi:hypothetical protein